MSFDKLKILPLLIFVSMLSFSVRLIEVTAGVSNLAGEAFAHAGDESQGQNKDQNEASKDAKSDKNKKEGKEAPPAAPIPLPNPDALVGSMDSDKKGALQFPDPAKDAAPTAAGTPGGASITAAADKTPADVAAGVTPADATAVAAPVAATSAAGDKAIGWQSPTDEDVGFSKSQKDLGDDLAKRRASLDQRERELQTKEALLKAGEQELDRKFQELTQLRGEIEKLLKQQGDEENSRIDSLVKIYQGMKPADAARIFDTLDTDILVSVMGKMSERSLSPVMAAMNPDRAKLITTMLAQQKQLPTLPPSQ